MNNVKGDGWLNKYFWHTMYFTNFWSYLNIGIFFKFIYNEKIEFILNTQLDTAFW